MWIGELWAGLWVAMWIAHVGGIFRHGLLEKSLKEGHLTSGKKKEPKPKLLSPDILRWGRGLPREGVGAKKFDMSLETREIKLFGRDIPGFCRDIPEVPEKFEKKKFCVQFLAPITVTGKVLPGHPGSARKVCERKKSLCSIFGPYNNDRESE